MWYLAVLIVIFFDKFKIFELSSKESLNGKAWHGSCNLFLLASPKNVKKFWKLNLRNNSAQNSQRYFIHPPTQLFLTFSWIFHLSTYSTSRPTEPPTVLEWSALPQEF